MHCGGPRYGEHVTHAAHAGSNVAGSLLGCREAIRIMRQQAQQPQPVYHIFNLGFSRWGASFSKSACTHKATKSALTQLTQSLSEELQEAGGCPWPSSTLKMFANSLCRCYSALDLKVQSAWAILCCDTISLPGILLTHTSFRSGNPVNVGYFLLVL